MTLSPIRRRVLGTTIALGLAAGGLFVAPLSAQAATAVSVSTAVSRILADTNALRAAGGLAPLVESAAIDTVAQNWSAQMSANSAMTHNPNYSTQIPNGWTAAAENIAMGYSYTTVVEAWHQSSGHYANIMGNYNAIGIGYYEANGQTWFVQDFGNYSAVPSPRTGEGSTANASNQSFVNAAYADVLGRTPSSSEVAGWTTLLGQGTPRTAVASGFNNSDEYRIHMINAAYQDVLNRAAESSGMTSWLNGMRAGTLQSDDVHRIFLSTDEFYQKSGQGTDAGYIRALYADVVGRAPTDSEVASWLPLLARLGRGGVVNSFWFAPETINKQAGDLFTTFLGRAASSSDVTHWAIIIRSAGLTGARNLLMSTTEYGTHATARFPTTTITVSDSTSGVAMPVGVQTIGGRSFTPVMSEDFTRNAALGSFTSVYGNAWGGYTNVTDTSGHGLYSPDQVLSVSNSTLDWYLHTVNGQPLVAAPQPTGYTGQAYGAYSVRYRTDAVKGYKTAFLLWPTSGSWNDGEIDWPDGNLASTIYPASKIVGDPNGAFDKPAQRTAPNEGTGWHTATITWTPGLVQFYLDGAMIGQTSNAGGVPTKAMRWVLQVETSLDGSTPAASAAGHVQVDWVVQYKQS